MQAVGSIGDDDEEDDSDDDTNDEDYVDSEEDTAVLTDSSISDHEVGSYASIRTRNTRRGVLCLSQMDIDDERDCLTSTSPAASTNTAAMVGVHAVNTPPSLTIVVRVFTGYE